MEEYKLTLRSSCVRSFIVAPPCWLNYNRLGFSPSLSSYVQGSDRFIFSSSIQTRGLGVPCELPSLSFFSLFPSPPVRCSCVLLGGAVSPRSALRLQQQQTNAIRARY